MPPRSGPSLTVKALEGVITRLVVNGDTLRLCLGLWGVLGEFILFFFCFQPPYKNIWGLIDADSAFLTSSPHFLFLESPCGFAVALAAPLGPLL